MKVADRGPLGPWERDIDAELAEARARTIEDRHDELRGLLHELTPREVERVRVEVARLLDARRLRIN
jgi:hypothetical protein